MESLNLCISLHEQLTSRARSLSLHRGDYIVPPNTTLLIDLDVLEVSQPNVFSVIDSDADGYFSPVDVSDYFKSQNWTEVDGAVESMFERLDMDKDGLVSWDEFDGPKGIKSPFKAKDEL